MFERKPCLQAYGLTAKKEGLLNANQLCNYQLADWTTNLLVLSKSANKGLAISRTD